MPTTAPSRAPVDTLPPPAESTEVTEETLPPPPSRPTVETPDAPAGRLQRLRARLARSNSALGKGCSRC
jgi:fused signal recognition particle receptor